MHFCKNNYDFLYILPKIRYIVVILRAYDSVPGEPDNLARYWSGFGALANARLFLFNGSATGAGSIRHNATGE